MKFSRVLLPPRSYSIHTDVPTYFLRASGDCTRSTEQRTFVNKHETFDPPLFIIHTPLQLRSSIHRASSKRSSFEPRKDRGMDRVYDPIFETSNSSAHFLWHF